MIVLADNDILFKLARCDLFGEFLAAFGITTVDVRIVRATRFSVRSTKHQKRIGDASYARLVAFLEAVADLDIAPDPVATAALTEQTDKNIDAGEAVLFATCPLIEGSAIVTGDKRSLVGLVAAAGTDAVCESLCVKLAGRVYCFEQILDRILDRVGFDAIRQRLIDGRECDRGLALWLGSGLDTTEAGFRDGLTSFLNNARQSSGQLLGP